MKKIYLLCFLFILHLSAKAQDYYLEDRWPNLKFYLPVGMFPAPDTTKRIFVIEQQGRIKMFVDSGSSVAANDTSTFLDLTANIPPGIGIGSETGLLGMAFHPQFQSNGYVYVNYTRKLPLTTVVSRFKVMSNNPNKLDPASQKILLKIPQPFSNHNGGSILFGADGYLYIATGDGGSGGDPGNRAQNKGVLLGKILRIDVNVPVEDSLYQIPPDNPFANNTLGYKKEIYALGVRNPWKMTKDPESSSIWFGDVGQNSFEEIDTLRLGANYGWKIMEGNAAYSACNSCDTSNYEKPIWIYGRSLGYSVTGGYVYRGSELYRLKGSYIYADYGSRRIWSIKRNDQGAWENTQLMIGSMPITSFGLDYERELYAIGYGTANGKLLKLRCGPPTPVITASAPGVCLGDTVTLTAPAGTTLAGWQWSTGDTIRRIKVFQPGNYSFQVRTRNTFGCWSYYSTPVSISVNTPPLAPVLSNQSICPGDTALFIPDPGLNYAWSTGFQGAVFSTQNPGNFWVIAADNLGCKSDTSFFSVAQFPAAPTPVLSLTDGYLTTDSIPGATYLWYNNGNLLNTTIVPRIEAFEGGDFWVIIQTADGCKSDSSNIITIVDVLPHWKTEWVVFPNPTKDFVSIRWIGKGTQPEWTSEISNGLGQVVLKNTGSGYQNLDIHHLAQGMYWLRLQTSKGSKIIALKKE